MTETAYHDSQGPWDPRRTLHEVSENEVRLSRGFLRCRPEKWFPGFGAHWLPLAHSLGADVRFLEARPVLGPPPEKAYGFVCSMDDEPFGIYFDEASYKVAADALMPGSAAGARSIAGDYLARRLMTSLIDSWSGPESSVVRYESEQDASMVRGIASVRVTITVNTSQCTVWLGLGRLLIERLDGLWRRQLRAQVKPGEAHQQLHIEIAELAVPPSALVDYLRTGSLIDLEAPVSDAVALRLGDKAWQGARLRRMGEALVCEVLPGPVAPVSVPEGTTRLGIELGSVSLDRGMMLELSQPNAMLDTGLVLSDRASLVINSEKVGEGTLRIYEGRFALTVG